MPQERSILFVLPEGSAEISGGNLYNAGLLAALEGQTSVRVVSARQWLAAAPAPGTVLVDTLDLALCEAAFARRPSGQHIVLIVHHLPSLEPGASSLDAACQIEAAALPGFDGFVTSSEFTRRLLLERYPGARVLSLEPPVTIAAPALVYREGQPVRALMTCNLIERKGVLPFLEALAAAPPLPLLQLDILGRHDLDRRYADACLKLVQEHSTLRHQVHFRGALPHSSVASWYQKASIFLSASRMETFGMSLQEARHHGLAILAVRGGNASAHVLDRVTGELCAGPEELARRVAAVAAQPTLLTAYSQAAQAHRPGDTAGWPAAASQALSTLDAWFGDA